ncbi:unnamed protein product [Closterium sp. Yama58-4]|nr:unnamed protein product [Closterium sp. Yama58-4]
MSPLGRARDKQCVSKERSQRGSKKDNPASDGDVMEVRPIVRSLRSGRQQKTTETPAKNEGLKTEGGDGPTQVYKTTLEMEADLPEPHDLVYRLRTAKLPENMKHLTLFNADGVGCVVEASDIVTIADGECITDAIVDFHNVLLSIRCPTTPNGSTWAAVDSKAFDYCNSFKKPYTMGNSSRIFDVDFLAIPIFKSSHYSLMVVPSPKRLLRATTDEATGPLELILLDSYGTHRDDPSVFDRVKLFLELTAKDLHPECDEATIVANLMEAKPIPMKKHQVQQQDNTHDCGIFVCQFLKVLVDTDFKTLRSYLYLGGVSALEMRRDMRVDLCMHAVEDLIPTLARLGVVVPRQPAPRVAKHGAVVDSGAEDGNTKLTRMQVEHYSMKRDLTIWKAAVTAVGAAMGYSVDQLIAGAAHVLQQQASDGEAATPGCSGSTAPSTPNPRAGARPGAPDSPGSKGEPPVSVGQGGAGTTNVDLGVVHPCPSPLPVPAKPLWSQKAAPVCVPFTHEAAHTVVHPGGTKPVVLAMLAKRKRDDTPSPGSDAEGAVPASKSKGNGQGRSSKWKGVRKEKRGRWSAKILFWEKDKPKYNKELEAATAYAAAVHVVKEGRRVSGTVELSDEERGLLKGCTLSAVKRLVRGRQWFRWTEWETALADCPEEDSGGEGETHSDSQDDQAADAHGGAAKEVDTEIEMGGVKKGVPKAQVGRGTPNELNEEEADTLDGVAEQGVASAAQGASQVTPQAAVSSSVGAGDEDVGSDGGGEDVPVRSKAVASVMADENPAAHDTAAKAPRPSVPDNPFVAMPSVSGQPASGSRREETSTNDNVVISRAELEALKAARDDGERRIARLEALLLSAQDPRTHNKRQRCSEDASSAEGDDVEAEAEPAPVRRVRKRRHMIEASSPILHEAFDFMPAGKAWKVRVHCLMRLLWQKHYFVREYLFIERGNDAMTFYPSSYDKTLGLCWVTPRLTLKFAAVALAADKGRRDDLNKSLSQWKTEVAGRVRDIALPRIGLWRDERDAKSPWRRKEAREAAEVRTRYRVLDDVNEDLTLSTWSESKTGMIFAGGAFTACAATAFRPKKVTGTVKVKLYQLAWLEHVVTDTILNWDKRKGRLSNSAGGNAQVVNGLQEVAAAAVAQAIQDFKPTYDADEAAWVWGEHGLMLSSDGLEHLVPGRYAHRAPVADDRASVSL